MATVVSSTLAARRRLIRSVSQKNMTFDILLTLIGFIASGLVGLYTALAIENAKRPSLDVLLGGSIDHIHEGMQMKSLYLIVRHFGVRRFRRFIYPSPALACVVRIRLIKESGIDALPASFEARWTGSQQPPEFRVADGGIYPSVFEMLKKRDIFPHTEEKIDVCIKYAGEDHCYIFNNSSYVDGYRSESHKIPAGVYTVEAAVSSGDILIKKRFLLRNDFQHHDFRLEEINKG